MSELFCEVALPVPIRSTFTYAIPAAMAHENLIGHRLIVPFRHRSMIGVGLALTAQEPNHTRVKEISKILDAIPALPPHLLNLGKWVSNYYVAPIGETFRAMLPPEVEVRVEQGLRITDSGRSFLHNAMRADEVHARAHENEIDAAEAAHSNWDAAEVALLQLCDEANGAISSSQLRKFPGGKSIAQRLLEQKYLSRQEVVAGRKARVQKVIAWNGDADRTSTTDAEKRIRDVLTATRGPLPLPLLLREARISDSVVRRLDQQGKLLVWEEPLTPDEDPWDTDFIPPTNILNADQRRAVCEIHKWLDAGAFTAALLHGVTGSGKTEVYFAAVEAALARGRSAIVLVPEIALTLWLGRLARARFGPGVAILHSGLPDTERAREWWRVRRGEARIIIGTRSAVFAPVENLGVIIVDEEQEASYKQEESPRYHGRDTALMRAKLEGAVALLGSATPSLETYQHARTGKYKIIELPSRVEDRPLATVEIVDLREEFKRSFRVTPISETLRAGIAARLAEGTQAMVLINRRGYSWFMLCRSCGATVQCQNCSISLTYHRKRERLVCHYCGYTIRQPKECPKCHGEYLYFVGDGAERVEEYLREQFPDARIGRLDRDTVRTKRQYQKILGSFAKGEIDVLVGTQMVAKGHDFERVTLVGVVSADMALGRPDFRAAERAFQLLTQVAGRAGRGRLPGQVLVETYYPEHYAIQLSARQDYSSFFEKEAHFRRMLHYPPFTYLANLIVRDKKIEYAVRWSRALAAYFAPFEAKGVKVLGPATAPLARLREEYRFQFLLKSQRRSLLTEALAGCLDLCVSKQIPEKAIVVDVDPTTLF